MSKSGALVLLNGSLSATIALAVSFHSTGARSEEEQTSLPSAERRCTLHVAGAFPPPRPIRSSILVRAPTVPVDPFDPSHPVYHYNPVIRALELTDEELQSLFVGGEEFRIIRHREQIPTDRAHRATTTFFPRQTQCHFELILSDVYAVFPNPYTQGVISQAVAGGNRLVIRFTVLSQDGDDDQVRRFSVRRDGGLPRPLSDNYSLPNMAETTAQATRIAFADFANDAQNSIRR